MGGTIANVGGILAGSGLGWRLRGRLPDRFHQLLLQVLGIFTLLLGGQMFLAAMAEGTLSVLLILGALLAGAMLGEVLQLQDQLQKLGKFLELRLGALGWLDPRLSDLWAGPLPPT